MLYKEVVKNDLEAQTNSKDVFNKYMQEISNSTIHPHESPVISKLETLIEICGPGCIEAEIAHKFVDSGNDYLTRAGIFALSHLDDQKSLEAIIGQLKTNNIEVLAQALIAIKKRRRVEHLPLLKKIYDEKFAGDANDYEHIACKTHLEYILKSYEKF